jgi:hypothetical protein
MVSADSTGVACWRTWPQPWALPNTDIAAELHLAEGTVGNHLSTTISKLGIEAARVARDRGWL